MSGCGLPEIARCARISRFARRGALPEALSLASFRAPLVRTSNPCDARNPLETGRESGSPHTSRFSLLPAWPNPMYIRHVGHSAAGRNGILRRRGGLAEIACPVEVDRPLRRAFPECRSPGGFGCSAGSDRGEPTGIVCLGCVVLRRTEGAGGPISGGLLLSACDSHTLV